MSENLQPASLNLLLFSSLFMSTPAALMSSHKHKHAPVNISQVSEKHFVQHVLSAPDSRRRKCEGEQTSDGFSLCLNSQMLDSSRSVFLLADELRITDSAAALKSFGLEKRSRKKRRRRRRRWFGSPFSLSLTLSDHLSL